MTKKLEIKAYDDKCNLLFTCIAAHFDCLINSYSIVQNINLIKFVYADRSGSKEFHNYPDWFIAEKVDHFNTCEGIVSLYYESGNFLEIRRLNA